MRKRKQLKRTKRSRRQMPSPVDNFICILLGAQGDGTYDAWRKDCARFECPTLFPSRQIFSIFPAFVCSLVVEKFHYGRSVSFFFISLFRFIYSYLVFWRANAFVALPTQLKCPHGHGVVAVFGSLAYMRTHRHICHTPYATCHMPLEVAGNARQSCHSHERTALDASSTWLSRWLFVETQTPRQSSALCFVSCAFGNPDDRCSRT